MSVPLYAITRKRFGRGRENEEIGPGLIDGPVASEVKFRFSAKAPMDTKQKDPFIQISIV